MWWKVDLSQCSSLGFNSESLIYNQHFLCDFSFCLCLFLCQLAACFCFCYIVLLLLNFVLHMAPFSHWNVTVPQYSNLLSLPWFLNIIFLKTRLSLAKFIVSCKCTRGSPTSFLIYYLWMSVYARSKHLGPVGWNCHIVK